MHGCAAIVGVFWQKRGFLPDRAYLRFKSASASKDPANHSALTTGRRGLRNYEGVRRGTKKRFELTSIDRCSGTAPRYFETDEENHRTFEVISRALKSGGQNLIQVPNVLHMRAHLPQRSWIPSATMVELVEPRWNKKERYMEGTMIPIKFGEVLENLNKRIEFRQPLHRRRAARDLRLGRDDLRARLPRQRPAEGTDRLAVRDLRRC
jgi:hypothetical protein